MATLNSIHLATPSKLGDSDTPTGIVKPKANGKVRVLSTGLEGDFQADKRVHGGAEKAIYQFPFENYEGLKEAFPHLAQKFSEPCIGENLSTQGMTDDTVFIGDIYKLGSAVLQVSQPRMPCWKVNKHIGNAHMMAVLVALNRSGWYFRVLEEGEIEAGDTFTLQERVQDDFSVEAVWALWVELRENKRREVEKVEIKGLSHQWTFNWG